MLFPIVNPSALCDTMEITTAVGCPNACKLCPQDLFLTKYKRTQGAQFLSLDRFKECIGKLPRHVRIDFSGFAEAWLNPECSEMILFAHSLGFKMTIFTTCVGMSVKDIEIIRHIPFVTFVVHLPDAEMNMDMPRSKYYLQVLEEIRTSRICNLNFMSMGHVHPQLSDMFSYGVSSFILSSRAGNVDGGKKYHKVGIIRCGVSPRMHRNVLLPNGDVVLCCMDYGMDHVLGNLINGEYGDLFKGTSYRNIMKYLNDKNDCRALCRYCDWSCSRNKSAYLWIREHMKDIARSCKGMAKNVLMTNRSSARRII